MTRKNWFRALTAAFILLTVFPATWAVSAQQGDQVAPPQPVPDQRFKVDILVVVAHPDDESGVSAYLAREVFDAGKRVAVIYATEGDAGRNREGGEQGLALGAIRQMETRAALASLGVHLAWFVGGKDTASQNPLLSLSTWTHGKVLERVVSIVRLTRPEVVISWMPRNVAGENHGDHQAAGIIATEAFDMAGDPTVFPEQLAMPRLRMPTENLRPWQPKKLYYYSDAFDSSIADGKGPSYPSMDVSPSRKAPYRFFALKSALAHQSQFGPRFPQDLRNALEKDDVDAAMKIVRQQNPSARDSVRLIFGKSRVGGSVAGDVFEGVDTKPIAFVRPQPKSAPARPAGVNVWLGDSWSFYVDFWRAHEIDHLADLRPAEIGVKPSSDLPVPVVLSNDTTEAQEVMLTLAGPLPDGWTQKPMPTVYRLAPGESYGLTATLGSPAVESREPTVVTWVVKAKDRELGRLSLRVFVLQGAMAHVQ